MSIPAPVLLARLESQLESVRLGLLYSGDHGDVLPLLEIAMRLTAEVRAAL